MVTVAVAGATERLGRVVVEAILATKKHEVIILTRAPKPDFSARGIDVRPVDYEDHASLLKALNGVHTVISCIQATSADPQLALLEACKQAGVKRFAPSEFSVPDSYSISLYAPKIPVWEATQASGLEYTRFSCGLFTNTLGVGTPINPDEAIAGYRPIPFMIDVVAGTADIPGTGNEPIVWCTTQDIGRFVAANLDLAKWEPDMGMAGDTKSANEVVAMLEQITGRKLLKKYQSLRELEKAEEEMKRQGGGDMRSMFQLLHIQVYLLLARGGFTYEPYLNQQLPDIKPTSVREYLETYWSEVDLLEPRWPNSEGASGGDKN